MASTSSLLSVSFADANGVWSVSRYFNTIRAARRWAKWLSGHSYVREVAIHRGGQGGERVS
jgi:hypothetical protein